MNRLIALTVLCLIENKFKWQQGTYQVVETGRKIIIDFGKSRIRRAKLINALYDIQQEFKQLFGSTFTTYYHCCTAELWLRQ